MPEPSRPVTAGLRIVDTAGVSSTFANAGRPVELALIPGGPPAAFTLRAGRRLP